METSIYSFARLRRRSHHPSAAPWHRRPWHLVSASSALGDSLIILLMIETLHHLTKLPILLVYEVYIRPRRILLPPKPLIQKWPPICKLSYMGCSSLGPGGAIIRGGNYVLQQMGLSKRCIHILHVYIYVYVHIYRRPPLCCIRDGAIVPQIYVKLILVTIQALVLLVPEADCRGREQQRCQFFRGPRLLPWLAKAFGARKTLPSRHSPTQT